MVDVSKTIVPKSDQLNADDLIAGEKLITITAVKEAAGDQPINVCYEGGEGKPWKPCKSMRRVLVKAWGANGEAYVGRQLVLFSDPSVKWAGEEVGGIRIKAMSHIEGDMTMMLTVSRGRRTPYVIKQIVTEPLKAITDAEFENYAARIETAETMADLGVIGEEIAKAHYDKPSAAKIKTVYSAAVKRIREAKI